MLSQSSRSSLRLSTWARPRLAGLPAAGVPTSPDALLRRFERALDGQRNALAAGSSAALGQVPGDRALDFSGRQQRLADAVLVLWRAESGLLRNEPLDLAAVAHTVVSERPAEAQGSGAYVSVSLQPAPVIGDARLTACLASSLLDNGLRHNLPGSPGAPGGSSGGHGGSYGSYGWVHVFTGTRRGCAILSVVNSGPLIRPADIGWLLEPFHRRTREPAAGLGGLGLGLTLVKSIAQAHGARLCVRALPAGGLDVEVRFPRPPAGWRGQFQGGR